MNVVPPEAASAVAELGRVLLDAKLSPPDTRADAVSRAELIDRARTSQRPIVAITAPAGYGKSTFLAEWAHTEDRPVAWVSLDRFDDDPATLLVSLASAFARVDPTAADLIPHMSGAGTALLGRAAPRLASALGASPDPFVLMLDDLHELRTPACHDVLGVVISQIPRGSQLVAASRHDQPHLARLRVSGDTLELMAAHLALDAAGAEQIFANVDVALTPDDAGSVTARTEGWPAGLYLAAVIARDGGGAVPRLSGEDRHVADYLYSEALSRQPEGIQELLRRTAVLDQLGGPLCDAVLGTENAAELLRHLKATSLFVVALDRERRWFRYHGLFREFLLGELRRVEPALVPKLHLRAADWYEANGSPTLAVEHLLHTAEKDRTTQLVTAQILGLYNAGQLSTIQRWLGAIGDPDIERYPPLAVLAGWVCTLTGDVVAAQRWAARLEAAEFGHVPLDGSASFESARTMLRAAMCAAGPEAMVADARAAVGYEPEWSPWYDTALVMLGEGHLLTGEIDEARRVFLATVAAGDALGHSDTVIIAQTDLALLAMDDGDWAQAEERMARAHTLIEERQHHDYVLSVLAFAGAARLALHRGDPDETRRQLARAMRTRPSATHVLPWVAVRLRLQLARIYLALDDTPTAKQLYREIQDVLHHRPALGRLADEAAEFGRLLAEQHSGSPAGRTALTPAELRLLPYLQTHLTFADIGGRLYVSRNTITTQAKAIYRKLGASSRTEAVERATAAGLLGA